MKSERPSEESLTPELRVLLTDPVLTIPQRTENMNANLTLFDKIFGGGLLAHKKTYIVALAMVAGAVAEYLMGNMTLSEMIQLVGSGAGLATIRAAIGKAMISGG